MYTGNYLSPFYFRPFCSRCQWADLELGEFQCLKLSFLNTTVSGRIKDGDTVCKCTRPKITQGENNPG